MKDCEKRKKKCALFQIGGGETRVVLAPGQGGSVEGGERARSA